MKHYFYQALEENPIIAAIKNMDDLELCCSLEEIRVVFVLFGDICTIRAIVKRLKDAGKIAIVHVDLIVGLSSKEIVVDFIKMSTEADGIISTKVPLIRRGNELNFITVQRCFLLDSMAYENLRQQQHQVKPDYIEVLPGIMPQVISKMCKVSKAPIIFFLRNGEKFSEILFLSGIGRNPDHRGWTDLRERIRYERPLSRSDGSFIYES